MNQALLVAVAAAVIGGCSNLSPAPTPGVLQQQLSGRRLDLESLQRGRRVYLTSCGKCHVAPALTDYPFARMHRALSRMIDLSKLDNQQSAELRNYLLVVEEVQMDKRSF